MATLSHSDSTRLYSWWWDSHVPKNSKWLQDNLTDMDTKVKAMIKVIEEDADSFARRAEMYYKKRPELMKLVEEFYRAYRALAERYDHMTGELRHTQRTIAAAFPNQLPFILDEEGFARSSVSDSEPQSPDVSGCLRALLGRQVENHDGRQEENHDENSESGLNKDLNYDAAQNLSSENENLKAVVFSESQRSVKAENEIQELSKTLADMQDEKDGIFRQYQICLNKLSSMEADLHRFEKDAVSLCEQKFLAESEVQTIKQALIDLEIEKEIALAKQRESTALIADFEGLVSHAKSNLEVLTNKVVNTESESQYLTDEISVLVSEKEGNARAYKLCQEKIAYLESKLPLAEENVKLFEQKAESAENEVNKLRRSLAELTVEKEFTNLQYNNSIKRIFTLESELSRSQDNIVQLNTELQMEAMKRKDSEKKCIMLEISKQSLHQEADDLAKKIAMRDDELSRNHNKLKRFEASLQDKHVRYTQIEANLQIIRSQAQEEHKALAIELETGFQMLNDLEIHKRELEDEVERVKDENRNLQEEKISLNNLQNEILYLKTMKTRLKEKIMQQTDQTSSLEQKLSSLVKEISGLNQRYQYLVEKLKSVGLNPDTIETYVKNLRDENLSLRHLREQMEEVSKKNNVLGNSLSQLHSQLEASCKEVREIEEANRLLVGEKSALLMQLHTVTENSQKALGNNAILENSLSDAKIELAGLREKSKGFEEICHLLKNEKSDLLTQRDNLIFQLENVERRIEFMENKYEGLEEKYGELENMNKFLQSEIQDLTLSISLEKQERSNTVHRHETLLVSAEQHIHLLQEENRWTMKEYEDKLDKAGRVQIELFVLQKFIQDMETKNSSLLIKCRKHVEASKLAEKLISELERENLEQEVEAEHFIDEIEKLRLGIYRIFKVLEADSNYAFQEKIAHEQNFVHHIIRCIEEMKLSIITYKDEKQLLQVENTVLSTLLSQVASEGIEAKSKNELLEERLNIAAEKLVKVQNDKDSLLDSNTVLKSQLEKGNEKVSVLQDDMDSVSTKHHVVEKAYLDLFENYFQLLDENRCLLFERSELEEDNGFLEGENDSLLMETLALTTFAMVLERALHDLIGTKDELEMDMNILKEKIEAKQENNALLEMEMLGVKNVLRQREDELVEADWNFRAEEEINTELSNNLVALKAKFHELSLLKQTIEHQLLEISEVNSVQHKEIEGLREVNANLTSELSKLRKECEYHSAELDAKDVEFEVWEGEAAAFYFDLQMSSIHGVFYESQVHELTEMCGNLEDLALSRFREIQEMKGKIDSLESEIGELKTELSAYAPVIASLKDDVTSLEHNPLLHTKLTASGDVVKKSARALKGIENIRIGIQDLQKLRLRIKAVEKTMFEEIKKQGKESTPSKLAINVFKSPDSKQETLAFKKGSLMKDIILDQISESQSHRLRRRSNSATIDRVNNKFLESPTNRLRRRANSATIDRVDDKVLELWQIAEDNNNDGLHRAASLKKNPSLTSRKIEHHPSNVIDMEKDVSVDQEANNKKILEKLASDARRLTSLQFTVENLKKNLDSNQKHKKAKDVYLNTVKEQLLEVQETVFELVELNKKLMGNFEGSPLHEKRSASIIKRNKVSEQVRKGSEKIGRLQVEVSKMENIMQKLEEEKEKNTGKSRFIKNKTTIILRDFIYNGRKNSGKKKKKKSRICGCFRSSSSSHGQNQM